MASSIATDAPARILVADDEEVMRDAVASVLGASGYTVDTAGDGTTAVRLLGTGNFDAIVADIHMPGLDGMRLLQAVRENDPDMPVILITGDPSLETAMKAVEYGALRYLLKPFDAHRLERLVTEAVGVHRLARIRRELAATQGRESGARDSLAPSFEEALQTLQMAFQPIVSVSDRRVVGYEALARPKQADIPHPGALFSAAERLGRLEELGRTIRRLVAKRAPDVPAGVDLFVNLHTQDLLDDDLFSRAAPLTALATRVVLEITERAPLHDIAGLRNRLVRLRELGFRIALDDMGAGYSGLNSFALLEPEVVKLDIGLIRNVQAEPTKQKLIRSMVSLCGEMGKMAVAEGVETGDERDCLVDQGCDVFQGFLFARPTPEFQEVAL